MAEDVLLPHPSALGSEQVAAGKSREEILRYFVDRYGEGVLREPPKEEGSGDIENEEVWHDLETGVSPPPGE